MNMSMKFIIMSTTSEGNICYFWEKFLTGIRSDVHLLSKGSILTLQQWFVTLGRQCGHTCP